MNSEACLGNERAIRGKRGLKKNNLKLVSVNRDLIDRVADRRVDRKQRGHVKKRRSATVVASIGTAGGEKGGGRRELKRRR